MRRKGESGGKGRGGVSIGSCDETVMKGDR